MEAALIEGNLNPVHHYALGVMLFQPFARARVSDLRYLRRKEMTATSKPTLSSARVVACQRTQRYAAFDSSVKGLNERPWRLAFIQAAKDVGIDAMAEWHSPGLVQ